MTMQLEQPSVQTFPRIYPIQEQLRFLVRYAILAPSSRNTQPWRFRVEADRIVVMADRSRAQPVADRDLRELYLSLGCAVENLLVAAEQFGFRHTVAYLPQWPDDGVAAVIAFRPGGLGTPERRGLTLQAILLRRSAHGRFTDQPISDEHLAALGACLVEPELELSWATDPERRRAVQALHRMAHEITLADPAFRHELASWVGQGAFGTPWPISQLGRAAGARESVAYQLARMDADAVGSAPLLLLVSSRDDDRLCQIRSGQLLERLWLAAAGLGLGFQPLSAALEVPRLRTRLSQAMGARLPWGQQLVRIGHLRDTSWRRTPRRPMRDVLETAEPGS